jgi:hypothetical protein
MDDKKLTIKDDINFLEYPSWVLSSKENYYTIEKENGRYVLSTSKRLPERVDKIVLYYLLHIVLPTKSNKLSTTRYNILKNTVGRISKKDYDKLIDSLKRWLAVTIEFEGVFYEGDGYTTRGFHILDGYKLNKDGKLEIQFNEQYLEQLRNTNYFKLINFEEYKKLKRPISARLYEILVKTFKDREEWQIGIVRLPEKLTLSERYPSQILKKLKPAVNEINDNTKLNIKLDYNKKTQICTFTKIKRAHINNSEDKPEKSTLPEDTNLKSLIILLPTEHRNKKTILESVACSYKKHGFDYTARNIKYTNRNCKGNYRAYFNKALKKDWGLAIQEDEDRKQEAIKKQEQKRQREQEELKKQKELQSQVREHMETFSQYELQTLREEAIGRLDEETKRSAEKFGKLEVVVRLGMEEIIEEKLKAAQC